MFLHQLNSKKNGPVLLCETILISLSCCLATNGNDGRVLKLEKAGPTFSSFNAIMQKLP